MDKNLHSQDPSVGYNIQSGGEGGERNPNYTLTQKQLDALDKGRHLPASEKLKKKLSSIRKNIIVSEETRKKLSNVGKNHKVSDATRQKLSKVHKGKKHPYRNAIQRKHYAQSSSDRVHIYKGTQNKNPKITELKKYLDDGWEIGYYYKK